MNAIAPRQIGHVAIPATAPSLPAMTPPVSHALAVALDPVVGRGLAGPDDPGVRVTPPVLRPAEYAEAQRVADAIDAMLTPITAAQLSAWLTPVNLASRNPQGPEEFALRVHALAELLGDLPAAAFTVQARRWIASQGFFPSAHDIREAIAPIAREWTRKRDALRNLHRPKPEAPRRGSAEERAETPEEREANAERNRLAIEAMKEQLADRERANREAAREAARKPVHIGPAQRIAYHRQRGDHATADAIARANGMAEA